MPPKQIIGEVYETSRRSLVKAVTFRILVIVCDMVIVSLITGKAGETVAIVVFTNLFSTILYFLHERIWMGWSWLRSKASNNGMRSAHFGRSLVKSISYRTFVLGSDLFVTSTITGSSNKAFEIIILTNLGSSVAYYIHEILWNLILWGKQIRK
jgi:adenylylsulfate kinase